MTRNDSINNRQSVLFEAVVYIAFTVTCAKMASLKERLKDNEYKLWIKDGLCLSYAKKGLEQFAEERSNKTHAFIKTAVQKGANVKTPDGDIKATNKICDHAKVVKVGNRWTLGCCNDCEIYIKEIVKLCKHTPRGQPQFKLEQSNWANSDVQLWPSKPWEMAKVYMNKGQKPFNVQPTAKQTDLSGLLNFIDHCSVPWVDIYNKDNISKVKSLTILCKIYLAFFMFCILFHQPSVTLSKITKKRTVLET